MNWIKKYVEEIDKGNIKTGRKVYKVYKNLVIKMEDDSLPFYFDEKIGEKPIIFIETFCKQAEGKLGEPITLELFQKAYLQALFGFINKEDGNRRFRETMFLVGRKNGKTTMLSAIALYMMIADGEGSAECYSVATKKDQAAKAFKSACDMRAQSPDIRALVKKRRSDMYMPITFSKFEPLASDSNSLDGLNSHLVIIDELHAIKDRNLYEVMKQSMGSRKQPLLVMITTAGTVRECIFDDMYDYASNVADGNFKDDTFLPIMYELDNKDEWLDVTCWQKANPGLGTIKQYKYLSDLVERAKNNSKDLPGVLCKDFNIRNTIADAWLSFDEINNEETFTMEDIKGSYAIGGCDLSATTDLTCATLLIMKPDSNKKYILQMYFLPDELIEKRANEDKIPYDAWRDRGLLTVCEGFRVNFHDVTLWYKKMLEEYDITPLWIYYDRALAGYWVNEMVGEGFTMKACAQGALTFSQPMRVMEADLKSKLINYNNNPVLKWCLTNTTVKYDDNDNMRPIKGKNQRARIDGMVSLLDAYVGLGEHSEDYEALVG